MTMKHVSVLLTAIGIAVAAPLAGASEDGLDLMPGVRGIERTQYVRDEAPTAVPGVSSADAFYSRGTGGIPPQ
jgi:hypothetical protein